MGGLNSDDRTLNRQNIESTFTWLILLQLVYLNYDGQNSESHQQSEITITYGVRFDHFVKSQFLVRLGC
jgi:hypothetical protein